MPSIGKIAITFIVIYVACVVWFGLKQLRTGKPDEEFRPPIPGKHTPIANVLGYSFGTALIPTILVLLGQIFAKMLF